MNAKNEETMMRWLIQHIRHAIEEATDPNVTPGDVANLVLGQMDPEPNETPELVRDAAFMTLQKIASEELQRRQPR